MKRNIVLILLLGFLMGPSAVFAAELPRKYLFYLHGAWVEMHGLNQPHPVHGPYQYREIVRALTREGFEVVSEVRGGEVHPKEYAEKVAGEVRALLKQGVPPDHILVAGHSKGGHMALIVASLVQEPEIRYVVMAGCGKHGTQFRQSYEKFLSRNAQDLQGRILSIYDSSDREAGSCQEAFREAPRAKTKEIVFRTGQGHGLFYSPQSVWIQEINEWAN